MVSLEKPLYRKTFICWSKYRHIVIDNADGIDYAKCYKKRLLIEPLIYNGAIDGTLSNCPYSVNKSILNDILYIFCFCYTFFFKKWQHFGNTYPANYVHIDSNNLFALQDLVWFNEVLIWKKKCLILKEQRWKLKTI